MNAQNYLSATSIVTRTDGIVDAEVDGEVVALNIDKGTCYGLNKVGSRIWTTIARPTQVGAMCEKLMSEDRKSTRLNSSHT